MEISSGVNVAIVEILRQAKVLVKGWFCIAVWTEQTTLLIPNYLHSYSWLNSLITIDHVIYVKGCEIVLGFFFWAGLGFFLDFLAGTICLVFATVWNLNLSFCMVFATFGHVHLPFCMGMFTFHFVWYLPHFGMFTFHFAWDFLHVGMFTFHFVWYLPHFGMFTFHFAWDVLHVNMFTQIFADAEAWD